MKKQVAVVVGLLAFVSAEGGVVRTPLDGVGTAESWKYRNGEKQRISADGTVAKFAFAPGGCNWSNYELPLRLPDDAVAITWKERTLSAADSAARFIWIREADGDNWFCTPPVGREALGAWRDVVVTFDRLSFRPDGNRKRELQTAKGLSMGFNFGEQSAEIKDVAVVSVRREAAPATSGRDAPVAETAARIVVLDCGRGRPHAADALQAAGLGVRLVTCDGLGDARQVAKANADLVVIPCSPFFPEGAVANFRQFLKDGGAFFAFGGYAFDRIAKTPETPGQDAFANCPTIADVNADRLGGLRLNSRFGKSGDTVKYPHDVISVFDPSFLVKHAAKAVAAEDQPLLPAGAEFPVPAAEPYFAAVAMTGSNDPVFPNVYGRWIPVLEAKDRFGRRRGPVLSLVLNYAGPYRNSAWAFSGHPTLFQTAEPSADRLLVDVCRRLLESGCLTTFKTDRESLTPGETVHLTAKAVRFGPGVVCRFLSAGRTVATVPFADGCATCALTPTTAEADRNGLVEFVAEAVKGGRVIDRKRTASVILGRPCGPAFAFADNMFAIDGRRRFFGGMNTTGMMWHSDNEDPLVWARDFADMSDYGMKFLRILHFSPFAQDRKGKSIYDPKFLVVPPCARTCRQTDAIVSLAAANGVGVFLALHDWMPWELEADELAAQARWNAFWVGRYAEWPSVFYDIQNEPFAMRMKATKSADWKDLEARDLERRRAAAFARWQKANGGAVHRANPKAAVTTGNLQNLNAVEKQLSAEGLDFQNVHHYGGIADMRGVVKLIDRRYEGKGLSLGEFGARVSHDARAAGRTDDPTELAIRHFLHVNHYLFGMGGAFTGVWDWKEFQDCVFPWGLTWQDGTPKPVLKAYRNMCLLLGEAGAVRESPALYLVLPDSFRLGGGTGRIHRALQTAADALLMLNVPFGVINEENLKALPASARALVWPLAVCPTDGAFASVRDFVKRGGALLVTGDFRFDAERRPTRGGRLAELGLAADFGPLDPMAKETPAAAGVRTSGRTTWSPGAVELTGKKDEVVALYKAFLDGVAKVPRLAAGELPDGAVVRFAAALEDGGRFETAINMTDGAQAFDGVTLVPGSTFWRRYAKSGKLVSLALAGRVAGLAVNGAPCALLALDGEDVFASGALAVLPFGPCDVTLDNVSGLGNFGEIGEFRAGRWTRLGAAPGSSDGATLRLAVPDDGTAEDIRLFALPAARSAAVKALEKLL